MPFVRTVVAAGAAASIGLVLGDEAAVARFVYAVRLLAALFYIYWVAVRGSSEGSWWG